jgi:5-methylcytosine-specific restriction endonuclease McrA
MVNKRKGLSYAQRIILAASQEYKCVGVYCKGQKQLPSSWEADHIRPLHRGGSNTFVYKNGHILASNYQIICPNCHAIKTQEESIESHIQVISPYFDHTSHKFLSRLPPRKKN